MMILRIILVLHPFLKLPVLPHLLRNNFLPQGVQLRGKVGITMERARPLRCLQTGRG